MTIFLYKYSENRLEIMKGINFKSIASELKKPFSGNEDQKLKMLNN